MSIFGELDWIVIPGGPGLSSGYMKYGLANSFQGYRIHYYDQLGSPEAKSNCVPSIDNLTDQIIDVIKEKKIKKLGFITHSFGNYLAMRLLEKDMCDIEALIMISPMPFVDKHHKVALHNIASKIPAEQIKRINKLGKDINNGSEIFRILFPYYATKTMVYVPDIPFDINMCNKISEQVCSYDDRNILQSCKATWVCIIGESDPFYIEKELFQNVNTFIMPGIGHYPFFEDQHTFAKISIEINKKYAKK